MQKEKPVTTKFDSSVGRILKATVQLRWRTPHSSEHGVLEQAWTDINSGEVEWRAVPTEIIPNV